MSTWFNSILVVVTAGTTCITAAELRTANATQIVAIENVCAWPNLTRMPDGTIIAIIHNQPSHGGMEGELECWASADGEKWEKRGNPAPHDANTVRMNHAAGLARNGDLIVLCSGWTNEKQLERPKQKPFRDDILRSWVCRSTDGGKTWSQIKEFPAREAGWSEHIPFGDIFVAEDGSLRASTYQGKFVDETKSTKTSSWRSWQFRSDDDGKTWRKGQIIGPRHNETSLFHAGGKRWLAAARIDAVELFASDDDGKTWNGPQRVTERNEINAHLARLKDGRLLLTYGNRIKDRYGVLAKLSSDEGKTWGKPIRLAKTLNTDCGYPSSIQRSDGKVVTAYYAKQSPNCDHYHMGVVIWEAATEKSANLIRNPGFESPLPIGGDPTAWTAVRGEPLFPNETPHGGERCLRLIDEGPGTSLFFESDRVHARPGGTYTASAWMRTADAGKPGVYINFYNHLGTRIGNKHARAKGPTKGWVRTQVSATAPDEAAAVTVSLYSFNSDKGTFDFDDAELRVMGGRDLFGPPRVVPTSREPIDIGSRRELFVDDFLIDGLDGVRFEPGRPRDEGLVLHFDRPWEGLFSGYCTIIKDGDILRLYYRGRPVTGRDGDESETTSYAESRDGLTWTRPDLGLYEFNGSKKNNIVLKNAMPSTHNFAPWLDARPGVPAKQRFKALGGLKSSGLFAWVSADGIHWTLLQEKPVMSGKSFNPAWNNWFDSQNVAFWSKAEQKYVAYFRITKDRVRQIGRATSDDFVHWSKPVVMAYRSQGDDAPLEHLYTNQTHPYFRAPHIYLSIAARFMPKRQVLTEEQARALNVNPGYFKDTSDAVLLTSRPGNKYFDRTVMSSFIRPGIGPRNWVSRTNYPARGVVRTGPAEMSVYLNQDYAQPTAHLRRYSLRLDGLMSLRAGYKGGEVLTKPVIFKGGNLAINFSTSAAGGIRVEIQDAAGKPHPGFALADCREQIGNEIERTVTWKSGSKLSTLAGKPVRLRILMKDADLYSLHFGK